MTLKFINAKICFPNYKISHIRKSHNIVLNFLIIISWIQNYFIQIFIIINTSHWSFFRDEPKFVSTIVNKIYILDTLFSIFTTKIKSQTQACTKVNIENISFNPSASISSSQNTWKFPALTRKFISLDSKLILSIWT